MRRAEAETEKVTLAKMFTNNVRNLLRAIVSTDLSKIFKVFLVLFMAVTLAAFSFCAYKVIKDEKTWSALLDKLSGQKEERNDLLIRDIVTPKIDHELEKMLYSSHAERICIFEVHNGKENATNLPFKYIDMTYESLNENELNLAYFSDRFHDMLLSHYKLPYYISQNTYFQGDIDDVRQIDPRFAQLMDEMKETILHAVVLRSRGITIGMMCFFYDDAHLPQLTGKESKDQMELSANIISHYLDLGIQQEIYNTDEKRAGAAEAAKLESGSGRPTKEDGKTYKQYANIGKEEEEEK